jgi:hypothetical protein
MDSGPAPNGASRNDGSNDVTPDSILKTAAATASRSRRGLRASFAGNVLPSESEGAGNAGRPPRPQPRVQNKKAHERSHHGHTGSPGIPCAMVLTVSFALSPVTGLVCHRRLRNWLV